MSLWRRTTTNGLDPDLGSGYRDGHPLPFTCFQGDAELEQRRKEAVTLGPLTNASRADLIDALGFASVSTSVGLDKNDLVERVMDELAADSTSLNVVFSSHYSTGRLQLTNAQPTPWVESPCPAGFVLSAELGAHYAYGLRLELGSEAAVERLKEQLGTSDLLELLKRPQALDDALNYEAKLEVFALQIGGNYSKPAYMVDGACSTWNLEDCRALLDELAASAERFGQSLGQPTVDDYAGWTPVRLNVTAAPE